MTTNLNKIPALVRDALNKSQEAMANAFNRIHCLPRTTDTVLAHNIDCRMAANRKALPLIEKLCQPNIVIVDLDDEKLVERVAIALNDHETCENNGFSFNQRIATAALAALKEKTND
jgi:hypothetical protein